MSKTGPDFDADAYAPVAERIRLFYQRHPQGRIETELVSRTEKEVVFKALVFRESSDARPAATGWASEREGDGEINLVACLENTETSAIGRALANLGFTASRLRPSAEEMAKAARTRAGLAREQSGEAMQRPLQARPAAASPLSPQELERANCVDDLLALVARAERLGVRPHRAQRWRLLFTSRQLGIDQLTHCEQRLRLWIARRSRLSRL